MSRLTQAPEQECIAQPQPQEQQGKPHSLKTARVSQPMPQQVESPLYAAINQRAALPVDEIPAQQLESPLYALVNQREQISLDQLEAQQVEYPLNAQINQRAQKPFEQLPAQPEPPLNVLINGHAAPRTWRPAKAHVSESANNKPRP